MSDEKILVVDDDKEICNLVERVLRKANYSVDVKTNPKEIDIKRLNKFDYFRCNDARNRWIFFLQKYKR